jgi:hypothetical protein
MLRFLALLTLRAALCLALLGVLIVRAWGWNEYASPELYVVYYQILGSRNAYFLVDANGERPGEALVLPEGGRATLDCSPDGRTLAVLTENQLVVMNAAGVVQQTPVDQTYTTVNVADDGTVALLDAPAGWVRVNDAEITLTAEDAEKYPLDRVDVAVGGLILWNQHFSRIDVVTPDRQQVLASVPRGNSGTWLPSSQIFTFYNLETDRDGAATGGGQYVMDIEHYRTVKVGGWVVSRPLSPDGRQVAAALVSRGSSLVQVVVYDLFTDANRRQLTFDAQVASQPICFLAFRPEALLSAS